MTHASARHRHLDASFADALARDGEAGHRHTLLLLAVSRLALRQTEGLIGSILRLLGLELAMPDHSTIGRRATTLQVPPRRDREPGLCIWWWTAPASSWAGLAGGWL